MAEFALGLTKTAVEGTLSRVKSAIEEETKLNVLVQNDLVFITGEFEMMQSFLKVASKERAKNEVVRTWVRQVRNLAFDVEDCVEFVVHLDKKSAWGWCRRLWHSVYCHAPPLPLDVAVAEIKQLKARVEDVSLRNTRYNLISDSGSDSKDSSLVEEPTATGPSAFHILREVWEVAGKLRGMIQLQELIARESRDLQVFSVWGSRGGDLGITSMFQELYSDPKICEEFDCRAWVKLKHPFHPDEFFESLLTQFYPSYHGAKLGADDLTKAKLKQHVNKRRYLVILEEVSTVIEWEAIKMCLLDCKNGSRIIVSTKQLGTALLCTGEPNLVSELRRFSDGQSLCAFFRKISGCCIDMGELKWHLRERRGVYSVCGSKQRTPVMVRKLFRSIVQKKEEFNGLVFQTYRWVRMLHPFNLRDFSRRLLLDLSLWDLEFDYFDNRDFDHDYKWKHNLGDVEARVEAFLKMEDKDLIEGCRKLMCEDDCLVAINCVKSEDDWDLINSTFLLDTVKGCIVVLTEEEKVAKHCVENKEGRILLINDLEADAVVEEEGDRLTKLTFEPGVVSVCGIAGVGKSAVIKHIYCNNMLCLGTSYTLQDYIMEYIDEKTFMEYSWVNVIHPFNLTDFSQRLLLDFYSDDLQVKEVVAVRLMEGHDPIQGCCRLLRERACLVVVDGLRSTYEWDLIKANLLPGSSKSCIIVITNEAKIAKHCVDKEDNMVNIKGLEPDEALTLLTKVCVIYSEEVAPSPDITLPRVAAPRHSGESLPPPRPPAPQPLPPVVAATGGVAGQSPRDMEAAGVSGGRDHGGCGRRSGSFLWWWWWCASSTAGRRGGGGAGVARSWPLGLEAAGCCAFSSARRDAPYTSHGSHGGGPGMAAATFSPEVDGLVGIWVGDLGIPHRSPAVKI
ncbi:uncharacterized protein LOC124661085 [Lolium rigidum]|uniref:uncharacterized protein LOC124661085 n=1 Tax=Lolium rigidum TaxID=89674 RepID=UPI001F5CCB90|nr:uncharacterized protein LOC124661085 [Lolium rigidum]